MAIWIVEIVDSETGTAFPLMGYCFLSEAAATRAVPALTEEYPESSLRVSSYFRLRREDLEWLRCILGAYKKSETLKRIIEELASVA